MITSTFDQVQQIISDIFGVPIETVGPDSSPLTIEKWDSIEHLNLVLSIEQGFGISFDPDELSKLTSVRAICDKIDGKITQRN